VLSQALRSVVEYAIERGFNELHCIWLGGEPLLAGTKYFKEIFAETKTFALPIQHFIQTNGLLLDGEYCRLFRDAGVHVGVSIDGPPEVHDAFRVSRGGAPTHSRVMDAIALLRDHDVPFGCVSVVSSAMLGREQLVYEFFRSLGSGFRVNPVIPRKNGVSGPWQVEPVAYGDALIRFFDAWTAPASSAVAISPLDSYVAAVVHGEITECQHQLLCADRSLGIGTDGTVTICSRSYEAPLGRLGASSVPELLAGRNNGGQLERARSLRECHGCDNWSICHGGCPGNALAFGLGLFAKDPFCPAYEAIFRHIRAALAAGGVA
jgi:uncharacterized protein